MGKKFSTDIEGGHGTAELFEDREVRHNFIKRVYLILSIQMVFTIGIISIFIFVDEVQDFVIENRAVTIAAIIILSVCSIALGCCPNFRRTPPMNYIVLAIFTLAESFLLGCICSRYDPMLVVTAVGITAAVCLTLSVFAMQTKWDFTVLGGFLCVCVIIGLIMGIIMIFVHDRTLKIVYCSLGVLLFSLYLLFDTQAMLGGNHKYAIEPDEYVYGAMNLYVDICQIFLCILNLMDD